MISDTDGGVALKLPDDPASAAQAAVRDGIVELADPVDLHFGGHLHDVRVAWRLYGSAGPVVAALGGISAGRFVADAPHSEAGSKGWWNEVVGPGGALDTQRFQVLGFDFLGGSGTTTGPTAGQSGFPAISAFDQAEILRRLLDHLQLSSLHAIVGASYGGMVALAFAERFPKLVGHIVVISAADRAHPLSTAWRSVQRAMVRYALTRGDGPEGLRLARALAMATYRSADEFAARFDGAPARVDGHFQFPVEAYLLARGDAYAASYVPEAFVCLSESIDLHRVRAEAIHVPATLIAVREDQLVPLADMQALRSRMGGASELVELSSRFGHDAFLKEAAALRPIFAHVLGHGATP